MTSLEMHDAFRIGADKVDSLNYPNFEPSEIDFLLNVSQDRFTKQRYTGFIPKGIGFEMNQKRMDDLRNIVETAILSPNSISSENKENGRFFTLPVNYEFLIEEEVKMDINCNGNIESKVVEVKPISHDEYSRAVRDPFSKPNNEKVLRLSYKNTSEIIAPSSATLTNYIIRYIKTPRRIVKNSVDCELAGHTHQEIVDMAVSLALENIGSERYQSNLQELGKQE